VEQITAYGQAQGVTELEEKNGEDKEQVQICSKQRSPIKDKEILIGMQLENQGYR